MHNHGSIPLLFDNLYMCDAIATLAGHIKPNPITIHSGMSLLRSPASGTSETVVEKGNQMLMGAHLHHDPMNLEA